MNERRLGVNEGRGEIARDWSENPEAAPATRVLPAWVGADVAGALIGAAKSLIQQRRGDIDWADVGWDALAGAAIGSTGVAGRFGKWLNKLF